MTRFTAALAAIPVLLLATPSTAQIVTTCTPGFYQCETTVTPDPFEVARQQDAEMQAQQEAWEREHREDEARTARQSDELWRTYVAEDLQRGDCAGARQTALSANRLDLAAQVAQICQGR